MPDWPYTHNICIQMNRKELAKTFQLVSKLVIDIKIFQRCKDLNQKNVDPVLKQLKQCLIIVLSS